MSWVLRKRGALLYTIKLIKVSSNVASEGTIAYSSNAYLYSCKTGEGIAELL